MTQLPPLCGFDTETSLITPGRLVPPLVCAQLAGFLDPYAKHGMVAPNWLYAIAERFPKDVDIDVCPSESATSAADPPPVGEAGVWTALVTREARSSVMHAMFGLAAAGEATIVAHNAAFDLAVPAEFDYTLIRPILSALDRGGIRDTGIREMLLAIAEDRFQFDRAFNVKPRWSLSELVNRYFGVDISADKGIKNPDGTKNEDPFAEGQVWRLKYCTLNGVAAVHYPPKAKQYALDDSVWALHVFMAQAAPLVGPSGAVLVDDLGNVTNEVPQTQAAFALHTESCWGIRSDPEMSAAFEENCRAKVAEGEAIATAAGFLRESSKWHTRKRGRGVPKVTKKRDGTLVTKATMAVVCDGCDMLVSDAIAEAAACPACGYAGARSKNMKVLQDLVASSFAAQGIQAPVTDKGQVSTSRKTFLASGNDALKNYAKLGVYSKYLTTYVPQLKHGFTHPINHRLNVLVRSGRMSGSKPNTTNPPREGGFRECFVPRPGHVYCSVDYNIVELRGLGQLHAWWFGSSALLDTINAGKDPHLSFGCKLLNADDGDPWPYDLAKKALKDAEHPLHTQVKNARQRAKPCLFGFPGGLGIRTFIEFCEAYGIVLDEPEARRLKKLWSDELVEMKPYFDVIARLCANGPGTVVHPVSGRQRGGCSYTAACNGFFQGIVADFAKAALYEVVKACHIGKDAASYTGPEKRPQSGYRDGRSAQFWAEPLVHTDALLGVRPVLFVHDEIIAEIPADGLLLEMGLIDEPTGNYWSPEQTTAAADEMTRIMCNVEQHYLPDVGAGAEPALMMRWYKDAKEVRGGGRYKDGRRPDILYPWFPHVDKPKEVEPPVPVPEGDEDEEEEEAT